MQSASSATSPLPPCQTGLHLEARYKLDPTLAAPVVSRRVRENRTNLCFSSRTTGRLSDGRVWCPSFTKLSLQMRRDRNEKADLQATVESLRAEAGRQKAELTLCHE